MKCVGFRSFIKLNCTSKEKYSFHRRKLFIQRSSKISFNEPHFSMIYDSMDYLTKLSWFFFYFRCLHQKYLASDEYVIFILSYYFIRVTNCHSNGISNSEQSSLPNLPTWKNCTSQSACGMPILLIRKRKIVSFPILGDS